MASVLVGSSGQCRVLPWANATAEGYANAGTATVIRDLGTCEPAAALSDRLKAKHWKVMPYETADGASGKMIWAGKEAQAPEVRLRLGVTGYHAIFVGLYTGGVSSRALLRLDSDKVCQQRAAGSGASWNNIEEVFFKVAQIAGDARRTPKSRGEASLVIQLDPSGSCGIAYVKLIPLSPDEIAAYAAEQAERSTRKMAVTVDGLGILYDRGPSQRTVDALLSGLEGFRDTDFGTVLLQYGGADQVPYPSKVASRFGYYSTELAFPENPGHRLYVESFKEFARKGINPYKVIIDGSHDLGMSVQVSMRPAMWTFWEPYPDFFESRFYREHPEWRTYDKDGTPVTRMSWAVPQVRAHLVAVLREAVRLGADGTNILFNRGFPLVLYEPAFVAEFNTLYPEDPKTLDDGDARLLKVRSDIIAGFLREVRTMLDDEAARRGDGKKLVLSASCLGNEADNLQYGLDIRRLVNDGLMDEVYPYKWDHGAKARVWDIKYFAEFCKPKGVRLSPILTSGYEFDTQVKDALSFYADGADSISYWDANGTWSDMRQWSVMSRLGHVEELKERGPAAARVFTGLKSVNGLILNGRYPPYMGG
jgi:hypothetical protein